MRNNKLLRRICPFTYYIGNIISIPYGWEVSMLENACAMVTGSKNPPQACTDFSKVYLKNIDYCCASKCGCILRICPACNLQGYARTALATGKEDFRTKDHETGLCEWHKKHGKEAKRDDNGGNGGNGNSVNFARVTALDASKKDLHNVLRKIREERKPKAVKTVKVKKEEVVVETKKVVAESEHLVFSEEIHRLIGEGKSNKEIAGILNRSIQFVSQCIALAKLSPKVRAMIGKELSYYYGSRIAVLPPEQQEIFAQKIIEKGFQKVAKSLNKAKKKAEKKRAIEEKKAKKKKVSFEEKMIQLQSSLKCVSDEILDIPVSRIRNFREQPRKYFDPLKIKRLADSLKKAGQRELVTVRRLLDIEKVADPDHDFELVNGERRWRAATLGKIEILHARVIQIEDANQQFATSAILNFNQEGHTKIELALMIRKFRKDLGFTIEDIAQYFGKSTTWAYQHQALLNLDEKVMEYLNPSLPREKRIPYMAAVYIAAFQPEEQLRLAGKIIEEKMKTDKACFYVREEAKKIGIKVGSRERSPKSDFNVLNNLLEGTGGKLEIFLAMGEAQIEKLFAHRDLRDRDAVIENIESVVRGFSELQKKIIRNHA